jgi:threonine dehydrogenase-like Zn-dependent dehydrogenase
MTGMMKAAVLRGPGDLVVEQVPLPRPGPGQQLVQVGACGICGSDLRYLAGENPWAKHTLGYEKPNPPHMVLGHEVGGWADLDGERCAVGCLAFRGCGRCADCHRGDEQLCRFTAHLGHGAGWEGQNPGGMAEWLPLWTEHLYRLPTAITVEQATFLDGLGVAVHAVRRAAIVPGGATVVLGGGPIGLMIAQVARALGAGHAIVADVYDTPLRCALELGLEPGFDLSQGGPEAFAAEVRDRTGGDVRAVFDTTGDLAAQQLGLSLLGAGGTLMLLAGVATGLEVTTASLAGERTITTSSNNHYADFGFGLRLMAAGRVLVEPMITHRFALDDAPEAFAVAADKVHTGALKVILRP